MNIIAFWESFQKDWANGPRASDTRASSLYTVIPRLRTIFTPIGTDNNAGRRLAYVHKTDDCGTIAVMAADFAPWLCFNRIYDYCWRRAAREHQRGRQILAEFKWMLRCTLRNDTRFSTAIFFVLRHFMSSLINSHHYFL